MGRASPHALQEIGARSTGHDVTLAFKQGILGPVPNGRQLCEPKYGAHMCPYVRELLVRRFNVVQA